VEVTALLCWCTRRDAFGDERLAWHLGVDKHGRAAQLDRLAAEVEALWALTRWNVSAAAAGSADPTAGSVFKLRFSEARQALFELAARVLGRGALALDDLADLPNGRYAVERLSSLSYTIAAGTSQIQRDIVAERILGLPKGR
jgi:alkylation response protein AidB-like acyl-CoA dehydrogenase